jgi:AcrR family transcriptional regulator
MARWQPDGRRRLQDAALELYGERGFAEVTAAEVAAHAGLTERTFFRHFADKKEILFGDETRLAETIADAVRAAPPEASPMEAVLAGFAALSDSAHARRDRLLRRERIIEQSADLRERELAKFAAWTGALADALRERGVVEAALVAEIAIATGRVVFHRWIEADRPVPLADAMRDGFAAIRDFVSSSVDPGR